jgi:hypothetical protein
MRDVAAGSITDRDTRATTGMALEDVMKVIIPALRFDATKVLLDPYGRGKPRRRQR